MATELTVSVYRPRAEAGLVPDDLAAAHDEVTAVDRMMSLYRADSELVALNAKAGGGPVAVSAPLFEVLLAAEHYARLSSGAFDVTVQPLVELWGFYRVERAAIPPPARILKAKEQVGFARVALDTKARTATLAAGTRIDLGAIAKGYAVDAALDALRARGVRAALVNLGGNIGVLGRRPDGKPWAVGIQHPRANRLIGRLLFWDGAVATSGDYDRYFEAAGKRYSHVLDPRSGWPADGVYSLTVAAPNATAADALSTAGFVLGEGHGMALLDGCEGVAAVMVSPVDDTAGTYTIRMTARRESEPTRVEIDRDADFAVIEQSARSRASDCLQPTQ